MYTRVLRAKSTILIALILALSLFAPTLPQTYADTNAEGDDNVAKTGTGSDYDMVNDAVLGIFLSDKEEFIMHTHDLLMEPDTSKGTDTNKQKQGYDGFSVNKAYYQQFGRSYIPWSESKVQASLLFVGRTVDRSMNGGVTLNTDGAKRDASYYKERAITRYPFLNGSNGSITELAGGNGATEYENLYFRQYLAQWEGVPVPTAYHTNIIDDGREFWMAPNDGSKYNGEDRLSGAGHFKKQIVEYLDLYFQQKATVTPDMFLRSLVSNPTEWDLYDSTLMWAYITGGIDTYTASNTGGLDLKVTTSAGDRWRKCFSGVSASNGGEFSWSDTFMSPEGLTDANGNLLPAADQDEQQRAYKQVAGYLDSLLTIVCMLKYNNKPPTLIEEYLQAAIEIFGQPGVWAKTPQDLEMKNSLVLTKVQASNWNRGGHSAVDAYDFYVEAQKRILGSKFSTDRDFRTDAYYSDWARHPLLEESPGYKSWATDVQSATMDRINLRLAMQSRSSVNLHYGHRNIEINTHTIGGRTAIPSSILMGPTSAATGRNIDESQDTNINKGIGYTYPNSYFNGLDTTPLPMVGGQFLIGFFAHASPTPSIFTHSLHATPSDPTIVPPSDGHLNQTPILQYRLGTDFDDSPEPRAISDPQTLQSFLDYFQQLQLQNPGAQIEIRTSFSSEVKAYRSSVYKLPSDPRTAPTSVPAPKSEPRKPIVTETTAGTTTVPTLNLDSAPWFVLLHKTREQTLCKLTFCNYFRYLGYYGISKNNLLQCGLLLYGIS